jgi:hypothetical protein
MTDLTEALLADGPDLEQTEQRERWSIDSDELAGWALRKLAAADREQSRIKQQAEDRRRAIATWEDDALRAQQHDIDFFRSKLIDYRRTLEAADPSLPKTYKLPEGSLVRRAGRQSTRVVNHDEFVTWALDNDAETLEYKPKVSTMAKWPRVEKDGVTYVVEPASGAIVPGLEVATGDDVYDVRPVDLRAGEPFA